MGYLKYKMDNVTLLLTLLWLIINKQIHKRTKSKENNVYTSVGNVIVIVIDDWQ